MNLYLNKNLNDSLVQKPKCSRDVVYNSIQLLFKQPWFKIGLLSDAEFKDHFPCAKMQHNISSLESNQIFHEFCFDNFQFEGEGVFRNSDSTLLVFAFLITPDEQLEVVHVSINLSQRDQINTEVMKDIFGEKWSSSDMESRRRSKFIALPDAPDGVRCVEMNVENNGKPINFKVFMNGDSNIFSINMEIKKSLK